MKKILFLAAVTALAFTACTSDELTEQNAQQPTTENVGVGFDVYVPGATQTRAGRTNVMTTGTLQKTGFGIYAYQTDDENTSTDPAYQSGDLPNYMWNQQIFYNNTAAGWYYAPLKYWPNETKKDSQSPSAGMPSQSSQQYLDCLTFFAYAPWVKTTDDQLGTVQLNSDVDAPANVGITAITATNGWFGTTIAPSDPKIGYTVATDPNQSVDLLWGVAPAGDLNYTAVDGNNVSVPEGMPLKNLKKPAVNTNMKFMFQHALARLGVKVVLAADQVAAGGDFDYANTKVTIKEIDITGPFGTSGYLNLNNSVANIANWTITATNNLKIAEGTGLAPHLVYNATRASSHKQQTVTGVTTDLADALKVSSTYDANYPEDYVTGVTAPKYSPTTPYFATPDLVKTPTYWTYNVWSQVDGRTYYQKHVTNNGVSYTNIDGGENAINTLYPNATVWKNIYTQADGTEHLVADGEKDKYKSCTAYRLVGSTYTTTGVAPEVGDYVFVGAGTTDVDFTAVDAPQTAAFCYTAKPNYFMVIPKQTTKDPDPTEANRTLKVKIEYYVSTTDASLQHGIVYTKNEVEKDIVLPHLKNGIAYNLKLILGLTSVKVEAEVADWVTTEGVVNLPQNTSE